jgi:hypothetical protein
MKKVVEHLKARLRSVAGPNGGVRSETPLAFLHRMTNGTSLETKPLRFAFSRLSSLLRTLQVSNLDDFNALTDVADFSSLLATYSEGQAKFAVIMEPNASIIPGATDPVIQLACLDASLAIAPLFKRFGSVVITSGTLSPIDLYVRKDKRDCIPLLTPCFTAKASSIPAMRVGIALHVNLSPLYTAAHDLAWIRPTCRVDAIRRSGRYGSGPKLWRHASGTLQRHTRRSGGVLYILQLHGVTHQ